MTNISLPFKLSLVLFASASLMFCLFISLTTSMQAIILEWHLEPINTIPISFSICFDPFSTALITTVLFITANVMSFSSSYMKGQNLFRFYYLIIVFVLSMTLFASSTNIISMMIGWDGLGVSSFLLVIYYQNATAAGSGLITIITNRIGDCLLLVAIPLMLSTGVWNMWSNPSSLLTIILMTLAAMTKSAQWPFNLWLPEAMAAPTPVSALVHSSTLVTAGVFLLIRTSHMFNLSLSIFIIDIGALTLFIASINACTIRDIKKIIALSTMSQLGLMFIAIGLNLPILAFFHLITHAMFKALMFIMVGIMIIMRNHRQNLTSFQGKKRLQLYSMVYGISVLSLNAMPFMAGFYSKEMILEHLLFKCTPYFYHSFYFITLTFVGTVLTTTYSARLLRASVSSKRKNKKMRVHNTHMRDPAMLVPIIFLSFGSIMMGGFVFSLFIDVSTSVTFFRSLASNIIVIFVPMMGGMFAWNTCTKYVKRKQPSSINTRGRNPLFYKLTADTHPLPSLKQIKCMASCACMRSEFIHYNKISSYSMNGSWPITYRINKMMIMGSIYILKYLETSLLEKMFFHLLKSIFPPTSTSVSLLTNCSVPTMLLWMMVMSPIMLLLLI